MMRVGVSADHAGFVLKGPRQRRGDKLLRSTLRKGDGSMDERAYEIGVVGLGVMGRNLALNVADHGFPVAGYDRDPSKVQSLRAEAGDREVRGAQSLEEMAGLLKSPRAVLMLVPAGSPVDAVLRKLL